MTKLKKSLAFNPRNWRRAIPFISFVSRSASIDVDTTNTRPHRSRIRSSWRDPASSSTKLSESRSARARIVPSAIAELRSSDSGSNLAKSYHLSNNGRGTRTCDCVRGQGCPRLGLRIAIQIAKLGE